MTPDVRVVHPDDSIARLRDVMSEKHIRHVPVIDEDGSLIGLVSERDLLRRAVGLEDEVPLSLSEELSAALKVSDVMTWSVETVEADDDVATAAAIMLDNKYGCLPVLEQGELAGILTEADSCVTWRRGRATPPPRARHSAFEEVRPAAVDARQRRRGRAAARHRDDAGAEQACRASMIGGADGFTDLTLRAR